MSEAGREVEAARTPKRVRNQMMALSANLVLSLDGTYLLCWTIFSRRRLRQDVRFDTDARLRDSLHRKELHTAKVEARWDNYQGIAW